MEEQNQNSLVCTEVESESVFTWRLHNIRCVRVQYSQKYFQFINNCQESIHPNFFLDQLFCIFEFLFMSTVVLHCGVIVSTNNLSSVDYTQYDSDKG